MEVKSRITRRYDIDWMRSIAVLLLIPFHTMHIFIHQPYSIVYIKNSVAIPHFEAIVQFLHEFHMPLLFFLAGASAYFSLQRRNSSEFVRERFRKLFLPMLAGILFLIPPMTYLYRLSVGDSITLLKHYINFFSTDPGDLSGLSGGFTPAHLWFILFLFVFSLAGLPLFRMIDKQSALQTGVSRFLSGRFLLPLLSVPLAIASAAEILDDKNPLVYFLFFLYGYVFIGREGFQKAVNRDKAVYLIAAAVFEAMLQFYPNRFAEWSAGFMVYELIKVMNRLLWVFVILGYGSRYLNRPSKVLKYLSGVSFAVYILHMPVNTLVGFFVVRTDIGPYGKFILIILLTTIFTFAVCEITRRIKSACSGRSRGAHEKTVCSK